MGALRKLIAIKKQDRTVLNDETTIKNDNEEKSTYYDSGYNSAKMANGSSTIFKSCLDDIYQKFKDRCSEDVKEQQKLNAPYVEEKEKQKSALKSRETLKSLKEDAIEEIKNDIKKIDDDIANVKHEPDKYGVDVKSKPKAQFFIGLSILLPITLYLLVFYISASYSAFFKDFETGSLVAAIFDANAFGKAINDGLMEAIFVCTIPFAFMGLGYLVHMFQRDKKAGLFKIALLFIVTFIFDAILAYQIEHKVYDFNRTLDANPFNLRVALESVNFWGIIFAGFVVYIIWGLVFDFIMKEYENIDKINVFIKKLKDEKSNLLKQKDELESCINDLAQEITNINNKINELQAKIDGFIFPNRRYFLYHAEYIKGWYMAIAAEIALSHEKKSELLKDCEHIAECHLKKHNILHEGVENVIYRNNLSN